jgi:hypothetical protein
MTGSFADGLDAWGRTVAPVLLSSLECAVPMHLWELRGASDAQRAEVGERCAQVIVEQGDVLLYGGKGCAGAFNALARGIAAAACQPGGVTVFGRHWCTDHAACHEAEAWAAAQPRLSVEHPPVEPTPARRPVVDVHLPGDAPTEPQSPPVAVGSWVQGVLL